MKKNATVITRFAPSPTGFLHVGGLRTALYNYLFAHQNKGTFLLRIEDTDQTRKVEGAIEHLQLMLKQFNVLPDNAKKPIIQSERLALYQTAAQKLLKEGKAYYCFCTKERLDELRKTQEINKQPPMYDGHCKTLATEAVEIKIKNNEPHVVRFSAPKSGQTGLVDLVRGHVQFDNRLIDDQIILKSDGFPTYHLASVIDDYDMGVTHVIRGEEWLPSVPKHILLYQALGYPTPLFAHLPLLLNSDKSKLSKRQGDVNVEEFLQKGYLPEALLNFIAFLGWNPGTTQEIFNLKEMISAFSLEKINKAGAVFNVEKLDWLNGHYIRHTDEAQLTELCIPFLIQANFLTPLETTKKNSATAKKYRILATNTIVDGRYLKKVIAAHRDKIRHTADIATEADFLFVDMPYESQLLLWKKNTPTQTTKYLSELITVLQNISEKKWLAKELEKTIMGFIADHGYGKGDVLFPMRAALTGKKASVGPFDAATLLGKAQSITRLTQAIKMLTK